MKKIQLFILAIFSLVGFRLEAREKKCVFVIVDGIPADQIERLQPPAIYEIAGKGSYGRAYTGGDPGTYNQTATISAIGYTNLITATWYNKHNVHGNSNLKPNYNYWSLFRIAKKQNREVKTALYSSWTDNRTVLIGEGKAETENLKIDFVKDGYDLDETNYPKKEDDLHIFDIDERISKDAAEGIRNDAPDLSWVYLWYTDDAGHIKGNGSYFDEYVLKADQQIARIWEAVRYREKNFNEDWLVIVTTDHGRTEDGHNHGGQSWRERGTWISTNVKVNRHFGTPECAIVDIAPTICRFMDWDLPQDVRWEQDGIPFIGKVDVASLKALSYDDSHADLTWKCLSSGKTEVVVYGCAENNFAKGEKDSWIELGRVKAGEQYFRVDMRKLPKSDFYKFVIETPNNHLNRWMEP